MENLKIHSEGNKDHLKAIRRKYAELKKALSINSKMSMEEKEVELEKLNKKFKKETQASNQNLY